MEQLNDQDPKTVGPYRLIARLGSGGMGTVYLAERGQSVVALKIISAGGKDPRALQSRFTREIENLKKMHSPFIAGVLDSKTQKESSWLAVKYVSGPTVLQEINENGPLSNAGVWELAVSGLIALAQMHSVGVVHRDIKPANILLSETGPKLIDFGISEATDDTSLTTTGLVAGSPAWLAPEQLDVGEVTGAADVFSLSSLLVFASSGKSPWGDQNTMSVPILFNKILSETPDVSTLGAKLGELLSPALAKDPSQRPAASALLSEAIRDAPLDVLERIQTWLVFDPVEPSRSVQSGVVLLEAKKQISARLDSRKQPVLNTPEPTVTEPSRGERRKSAADKPPGLRQGFRARELVVAATSAVATGALALLGFSVLPEQVETNAEPSFEALPTVVQQVVEPPSYSFTTVSDSRNAQLVPGDGSEVTADKEFDFQLLFIETPEFIEGAFPEVTVSSVGSSGSENSCLGTQQMNRSDTDPAEFVLPCTGIPEGAYIVRVVWEANSPQEEEQDFGRETITAFIESKTPTVPESSSAASPVGGSGSLSYEFLGGGWGAFDDAQYFSISGSNLVRSWCLRSAPGMAWRDDNNWAEVLNPDGSVLERVAGTQNQGPCTITGSANGMEDGDPGELRSITVPRSTLASRLDPTNCLIVRFKAGGSSFQPEFNDICVRG